MIKVELESGSSISGKPAKVLIYEDGKLAVIVTATMELAPCASNELNEYIKLTQEVIGDKKDSKPNLGDERTLTKIKGAIEGV